MVLVRVQAHLQYISQIDELNYCAITIVFLRYVRSSLLISLPSLLNYDFLHQMNFEPENGLALGATEEFLPQHYVHKHQHGELPTKISKLAIELEWVSQRGDDDTAAPASGGGVDSKTSNSAGSSSTTATTTTTTAKRSSIRSPIVRGAPYTSMKYFDATPRIFVERKLSGPILVDSSLHHPSGGGVEKASGDAASTSATAPTLECGQGKGNFSPRPVLVQRELKLQFDTSDMTWLVFVSQPTEFTCSNYVHDTSMDVPLPPGIVPVRDVMSASYFDLRATKPMHRGMVRVAMSNNCTTGQNAQRKCKYQ